MPAVHGGDEGAGAAAPSAAAGRVGVVRAVTGRRGEFPCALLVVAVDGTGEADDAIVAALAGAVEAEARGRVIVHRWGGHAYVVLIHGPRTVGQVEPVAQRVRSGVAALRSGMSVVVGGAVQQGPRRGVARLLWTADAALHAAGVNGRDVVLWTAG